MMDKKELHDMSDEVYFGHLKTMFRSPGWEIFMLECADNATSVNSVESTQDGDDLFYRKGQLAILGNILNTENTILNAESDGLVTDEDT